eukprot:CAMPEP_0117820532 /NCGR_PEP_ID=MMETSP0949-20121206/2513_1 /TAXON_ID=44440 /ORGANISM="Chattonella subsalsa, Strain CCMP2191" /LENGTH=153 /DNA_ID=CAMNT_0005659483 /DNA_START=382 /DNA_END=840 /DNA_ORIENTATION=+
MKLNKDGLIYDPRTGRFYEKAIEEICRDEFCTVDEKTGEPVMLTVKEKERIYAFLLTSSREMDKIRTITISGEPVMLTVKEKERIFLDSLQAYYYDGRNVLTDDDFDKLKADLIWEGSPLATLSRDETLFLNAMSAYMKGNPIISDAEFDELK